MKRSLTMRERVLIVLVAVAAVVWAYWNFWAQPVQNQLADLASQEQKLQSDIAAEQAKVQQQKKMQSEIAAVKAAGEQGSVIAQYDNFPALMQELNTVLAQANTFSLSFGNVDTSAPLVKRSVTLTYSCSTYAQAQDILAQLRNGQNRCVIESVSISMNNGASGSSVAKTAANVGLPSVVSGATVNATLVFFEYKG